MDYNLHPSLPIGFHILGQNMRFYLISHHAMQTYGGMEVQFHVFFTSNLNGYIFSFRHLTNVYSACSQKKACWASTAVRKFQCRKQNPRHYSESTSHYWVVQPVA